ncbi:hypothetical protein Tsubulata_026399 [Turnera subulata]|uniref:Uncharacterized protein n=1 Tax=Turnera subulata TaxID=218843 RepID=A0A9Q0JF50_9ROSI|nr:hypothetical protein Tsubulata_026399 [Turnera subulata]
MGMELEGRDDSFKKPGAVPFKWEIRPGVPKIQQHQKKPLPPLSPPILPSPSPPFNNTHRRLPSPTPPRQKLKPPPPGSIFLPSPEPRSSSFRSSTPASARSERWRLEQPTRVHPDTVSVGCFPSPLLGRKSGSSRRRSSQYQYYSTKQPDYTSSSELETPSRWSVSSRKSAPSFRDSPMSSSFSSYQSSPRVAKDADWAGFGLF